MLSISWTTALRLERKISLVVMETSHEYHHPVNKVYWYIKNQVTRISLLLSTMFIDIYYDNDLYGVIQCIV